MSEGRQFPVRRRAATRWPGPLFSGVLRSLDVESVALPPVGPKPRKPLWSIDGGPDREDRGVAGWADGTEIRGYSVEVAATIVHTHIYSHVRRPKNTTLYPNLIHLSLSLIFGLLSFSLLFLLLFRCVFHYFLTS